MIGVGVAKTQTDLARDIVSIEQGLLALLGADPGPVEPTVLPGYLGEAYALPTAGATAAFNLLAKSEAVLTDSVYSAKGVARGGRPCPESQWPDRVLAYRRHPGVVLRHRRDHRLAAQNDVHARPPLTRGPLHEHTIRRRRRAVSATNNSSTAR